MAKDRDNQPIGLLPGTRIGKYEVREKIGSGGMSVVFKCYDVTLDRFVAAKQISPHLAEDRQFLERFRREAQILAQIGPEQPSVVTIYDLVEDPRGLFIMMEYVAGPTLEQMLSEGQPVAPKTAVQLLWRLAGGMTAVHAAGIVHRDLKPSNIIVAESLRPKITDFGVAASLSGQTSMLMGTTKYMAPELFAGGVIDGRTDMYALGFIMYELLLGREKFNEIFADVVRDQRAATVRWMKWHGNDSVSAPPLHNVNSAIPKPLGGIVARMMAKDIGARFADMEELGRAVRTDLAGVELADQARVGAPARMAPPVSPPSLMAAPEGTSPQGSIGLDGDMPTAAIPKRQLSRKTWLMIAIVAGVVILGAVIGGLLISQHGQQKRNTEANELLRQAEQDYDDEKYDEAAEGFHRVSTDYAGTQAGNQAGVLEVMAQARSAIERRQWDEAEDLIKKAEDRVEMFQKSIPDTDSAMLAWSRATGIDIGGLRDYRISRWLFEDAFERAVAALDSGDYDQALEILRSDVPQDGLTEEMIDRQVTLRADILDQRFESQFAALVRRIESASERGSEAEALKLCDDATTMLDGAADDRIIPAERIGEYRVLISTRKQAAQSAREIGEIKGRIEKAETDGDLKAEKRARVELQAILPSGDNATRITQLTVEIMYADARALLDKDGATGEDIAQAREILDEILEIMPDFGPAARTRGELERLAGLQQRRAQAEQAFAAGLWGEACDLYEALLAEEYDEAIEDRITECRFNERLQKLDALRDVALADGNNPELRRLIGEYELLFEIDAGRAGRVVAGRLDGIQRVLDRADAIERGRALMDEQKWQDAKRAFEVARDNSITDEEDAEIQQLITLVDYKQFMVMGQGHLERGDYVRARAAFLNAQRKMDTPEVRELLGNVAQLIADEESS